MKLPPPAWLRLTIVLGAARQRISCSGNRIALEHKTEEVVTAVRNSEIGRGLARYESALRLIAQHCDELGAIIGLAAQRLVRDNDRGSRQCGWRDAIEHILRNGDAVERGLGAVSL